MPEHPITDLATCTTDELWDELKTRFSDAILVYQRPVKIGDDFDHIGCFWRASFAARMGLAQYAVEKFKDMFRNSPEDDPEDDEEF